ncbi:DUF2254 domain-containing protein [Rhodobacterales bacterium HKCCE2091]|nr:DUF2254 domain-containing protein [Rhodobacterales bacterium HKCCE2091]
MISSYLWKIRLFLRQVWVRVLAFAVLALAATALAPLLAPLLPEGLTERFDDRAVEDLLKILASSMLAVTTFSLSIAVNAFGLAAQTATPRVTKLLEEDRTTQNALATFLGAFLFSLLGLVALNAAYYGPGGQTVLYGAAILVIALVIFALIRWIGHLMRFGRMEDALDRVEAATAASLSRRLSSPRFGARPAPDEPPAGAHRVTSDRTGYVQHVDIAALSSCAEDLGADLYITRMPGDFVHDGGGLLRVAGAAPDEDARARLRSAWTIGHDRVFDDDPLFGFVVMAEIASRALSPGVNDPGSAIGVIGRTTRLLLRWRDREEAEIEHPRLYLPGIAPGAALTEAFAPIARDGAGLMEVQTRLQDALAALSHGHPGAFAAAAARISGDAVDRARAAGATEREMEHLEDLRLTADDSSDTGDHHV